MPCTSTPSSCPPHLPVCLRASDPSGAVAHAQLQAQPSGTDTPASSSAEIGPEVEAYRCTHVRRQLSSRHQQHASSLLTAAAAAARSPIGTCGARGAREGFGFKARGVR